MPTVPGSGLEVINILYEDRMERLDRGRHRIRAMRQAGVVLDQLRYGRRYPARAFIRVVTMHVEGNTLLGDIKSRANGKRANPPDRLVRRCQVKECYGRYLSD